MTDPNQPPPWEPQAPPWGPPPWTPPPWTPPPGGYGGGWPRRSQAVTALVLSIAGILCCPVFGIAGLVLGRGDVRAIDTGQTDPSQRGTAQAAVIIGALALAIWGALVLGWVLLLAAVAGGA